MGLYAKYGVGLGVLQFLYAQAMDFREDEIEVLRTLEPAFLGQVDIAVKFPQDRQQGVVGEPDRLCHRPATADRGID